MRGERVHSHWTQNKRLQTDNYIHIMEKKLVFNSPKFGDIAINKTSIVLKNSFEIKEGQAVPRVLAYDSSDKVTLYRSKEIKATLFELSPSALRLFLYVAYMSPKNSDIIRIRQKVYSRLSGTKSKQTFYNAIKELIAFGIISPIDGEYEHYLINPQFIFKGNRLKHFDKD